MKKLLPDGSSVEDVHLSAHQTVETALALSVLGSNEHFEREMEMLLQVSKWIAMLLALSCTSY